MIEDIARIFGLNDIQINGIKRGLIKTKPNIFKPENFKDLEN